MKKFFSLIAAVLFAGSMMATDYQLVTSTDDLEADAMYVIGSAASGSGVFMSTEEKTNNRAVTSAITITNGKITGTENLLVLKLGGTTGAWTFLTTNYAATDGYLTSAATGKNNYCKVVATAEACSYFTIDFSGNAATIKSTGRNERNILRYNSSTSPAVFACYSSGQNDVFLYKEVGEAPAVERPVIAGEENFFDETEVSITCSTEDAKIYYTIDGTEPSATSIAYSAAFKLNASATVKAIAIKGEEKSAIATKAFTKAPVYASIEALVDADLATGSIMQVSFKDVEITDIYVTKSEKRQGVFLNVKAGGKNVEIYYAAEEVPAAWVVGGTLSGTIKATWTYYNNTQWEIIPAVEGWKWTDLTYEAPSGVSIVVKSTSIEVPAAGKSATVDVEYVNIEDLSSAAVAFYEADGTTPATYAWLEASLDANKDLAYDVEANANSEARTAYLKVYVGEVYSALVTLTQAGYVPDYAALPFAFDGGKNDIASTVGLTQSGLGTDYSASPKLKFDGTGDCLILKINEDAGDLSFDIKGNTFSEGTFTVQTSADGETYTDLKACTELGATASEKLTVAAGVRYIKWIYTEKVNGNVALGNIALAKSTTTAIDNAAVETKAIKRIENGKLVIIKNGVRYDAQGARL